MNQNTLSPLEKSLAEDPIGRLIARFAIPSIIAMLVNALYNLVDQIFISRSVGYLGNGAANVVQLITITTLSIAMLFGDGAAAFFSLRLGEGRREEASRGVFSALYLLAALSLLITALCLAFLTPILRLSGCTGAITPYAREYGAILILGLPFLLISTALNAVIRVDGSPRYAMASMIAGAVLNALLDPLFLFVFRWGMKGAAFSTVLGQLLTFLFCALYFRKPRQISLPGRRFRPQWKAVGTVCGLGVSSFIDQLSFSLVMAVNNNLMAHYGSATAYGGEIPLTSYGVSMKLQEILFTLVLGVAIGMQPIAGFNYGAGNHRRAKQAYGAAVAISTGICVVGAAAFFCFPTAIAGLFGASGHPLYLEFTKRFLRTYFLFIPLLGFQTVSGVFLQATGKPRKAAGLSLSYQLLFKILSAVGLSTVLGLDGVLWSGPLADLLAFALGLAVLLPELRRPGGRKNPSGST